jgi:mRNA degradation ribonuclease J1/J2
MHALGETRRTDLEFCLKDMPFRPFRTGEKLRIGSLEIEPVHVDHSVPGAYGFVIGTSRGTVVYIGDFRTQGSKPQMTRGFVDKAREAEPVAVITEATNMTGASISSEKDVENKLNSIVSEAEGIVFADYAYADVDRLNSFVRIARNNGRCLAVSLRQANLLNALQSDRGLSVPDLNCNHLLIFRKSKERHEKWETHLERIQPKSLMCSKLRNVSANWFWLCPSLTLKNLFKLTRTQAAATSCLRRSLSTRKWKWTSES